MQGWSLSPVCIRTGTKGCFCCRIPAAECFPRWREVVALNFLRQ